MGIGVPDVGFRLKLEGIRSAGASSGNEALQTIDIMKTLGAMTGQPCMARSKSIAAFMNTSYLHLSTCEAETKAATASKEERM